MTLSEQFAALEKRITELEQDNQRVAALEEENKRLHDTIAHLTKKLFGKRSEKTSALSEGQCLFLRILWCLMRPKNR